MRAKLVFIVPIPFFAFGCFNLSDDPQFDAGPGIHFDGGTFDGTLPDGALDATPDAPFDAGPQPVKVLVLKGGLPESGVNVVFQDAMGAVVEAKTTALDGTASRLVDPGTMVTVALGGGGDFRLVTVLAVQPGDVLTALDDAVPPYRADSVTADVPANPPATATAFQSHSGPCISPQSQGGTTDYVVSPPDCERAGKFPVLTVAYDDNALPVGFAFKKGNVIDVDAGTTQVTGLSAWTTTLGSVALTATNAGTATVHLAYSEIADGIPYSTSTSGSPTGGTFAHTFDAYPGYADFVQVEMGATGSANGYTTSRAIAKRSAPPAAATSFDFTQLLPAFTDIVDDTTTDPLRPSVALTLAGTPTGADGLVVQITWSSFDIDAGQSNGQWIIVAPAATAMVKAPSLPTGLAAWLPPSGAGFDASSAVIVDSDQLPGYAQLRSLFAAFPSPTQFMPSIVLVPPLPTNGTVRISAATPQPG